MVLFSALLKMQDMTLKVLLNSFMPHYPPIYKTYLQRVLAPCREETENSCHCRGLETDEVKPRFYLVIPTDIFFLFKSSIYLPHN